MSHVAPWLTVVATAVIVSYAFLYNRRVARKAAHEERLKEWYENHQDPFDRASVAEILASVAFIHRAAGVLPQGLGMSARGPLSGYVVTEKSRTVTATQYVNVEWQPHVHHARCAKDLLWHESAEPFVLWRLERFHAPDFPGELFAKMIAEAASQQASELTRSWNGLDAFKWPEGVKLRDEAGFAERSEEDAVLIREALQAARDANRNRRPELIDIHQVAQQKFDQMLSRMQSVLDANEEGIARLKDLLLSQPIEKFSYDKYDDKSRCSQRWAGMTQGLYGEQVKEFFLTLPEQTDDAVMAAKTL